VRSDWPFRITETPCGEAATETPTMKKANSVRELEVYQAAFTLQQEIFQVSKAFPKEEMYSLTDQIRRASRSIGSNLSEAWSKRRYPAHFLSKLTDSDGELQETHHWLDTAEACGYLTSNELSNLKDQAEAVGRQLGMMLNKYESFCF
jgi:four helix bundle protein